MPRIAFMIVCMFLLSGCGGSGELRPLPQGEQTVSGILLPAELSLVRRGSHLLRQEGVGLYYVESSLVQLRTYEGRNVTLTGLLEYNTDPFDLPVLVVSHIEQTEEETRTITFRSIGLSLTVPHTWNAVDSEDGGVQFFVPAWDRPVLSLFEEQQQDAMQGFSITVGGRRALRFVDEQSGAEKIAIEPGGTGSLLTLLFTPGMHPQITELKADWLAVLRSISFAGAQGGQAPIPSTGTGTAASGVPCGGSAGILCPEGYYCAVSDLQENIGVCRKIR